MSEKNVENQVQEVEFTEEQVKNQIRMSEKEMLAGLLEAAEFSETEETMVEIKRKDKVYFRFSIRPLSEADYNACRKKHTKYLRNKQFGMKLPEETDNLRYRAALIYSATVDRDKKILWELLRPLILLADLTQTVIWRKWQKTNNGRRNSNYSASHFSKDRNDAG